MKTITKTFVTVLAIINLETAFASVERKEITKQEGGLSRTSNIREVFPVNVDRLRDWEITKQEGGRQCVR